MPSETPSTEHQESAEVDIDRVDAFMVAHLGLSSADQLVRERLSGGLSQLTVKYSPKGAPDEEALVVRIPPLSGPQEPYDPVLEANVTRGAQELGVPVPTVSFIEETGEAIGRQFYATHFVPGTVVAQGAVTPSSDPRRMAESFLTNLVALNSTLSGPSTEAARRTRELLDGSHRKTPRALLERWTTAVAATTLDVPPYQAYIAQWLLDNCPDDPETLDLVHGDYRLANVRWGPDDLVNAVVDWEEAGLGDPYFDLAWTIMGSFEPTDVIHGLVDRQTFLAIYVELTGRPLDQRRLLWWEVACGWTRLNTDALAIDLIRKRELIDIRPMLSCFMNRRIAEPLYRKIFAHDAMSLHDDGVIDTTKELVDGSH